MPQILTILTGASRGMGAAMAEQLLTADAYLLCLSRGHYAQLATKAQQAGAVCEQWAVDLTDPLPAARRLQAWLQGLDAANWKQVRLINNAGMIARVGPSDETTDEDLSAALRVGLEAAVLLSAAMLRATRHWTCDKRILNISSGLGRRAMAGSATYCAAKAGMDHFSRAMALDEAQRPHGARVVSLAPGVIETDMQVQLRGSDPAGFPDRSTFLALKEQGQLSSPAQAPARILAFLSRADFGEQAVADVRDA